MKKFKRFIKKRIGRVRIYKRDGLFMALDRRGAFICGSDTLEELYYLIMKEVRRGIYFVPKRYKPITFSKRALRK